MFAGTDLAQQQRHELGIALHGTVDELFCDYLPFLKLAAAAVFSNRHRRPEFLFQRRAEILGSRGPAFPVTGPTRPKTCFLRRPCVADLVPRVLAPVTHGTAPASERSGRRLSRWWRAPPAPR